MSAVVWTSGNQRFAVPTASVVEVLPVVQSSPLPHAPPAVLGIFNYRGQLIPLLDAAALLGQETKELRRAARILVLRHSEDRLAGLLVQQVLGSEAIERSAEDISSCATSYLGATVLAPSGMVQWVDPAGLPIHATPLAGSSTAP